MKMRRLVFAAAAVALAIALTGCPGTGTTPTPDPPPQADPFDPGPIAPAGAIFSMLHDLPFMGADAFPLEELTFPGSGDPQSGSPVYPWLMRAGNAVVTVVENENLVTGARFLRVSERTANHFTIDIRAFDQGYSEPPGNLINFLPGLGHTITVYGAAPPNTEIRFERTDQGPDGWLPAVGEQDADPSGRFRISHTFMWEDINIPTIRGIRIGVPANIDFDIFNIIVVPYLEMELEVGPQVGTMMAGAAAADGENYSVTFQVTAENAFPGGGTAGPVSFNGAVTGLPASVLASGSITLDEYGTSTAPGTLTLTGDGNQSAGVLNLILVVGQLSAPFTLTIVPGEGAPSVSIGAAIGSGIYAEREGGYVEFEVTAANLDVEAITAFPHVVNFVVGDLTGDGWPVTGIDVSGSISINDEGAGTGTLTLTAGNVAFADVGEYSLTLTILGQASFNYAELVIAPPAVVFRLTDWLAGMTSVNWESRPVRGNDHRGGASNATLVDGGLNLDVAGDHQGLDILLPPTWPTGLPLDLVNNIYEITVIGNTLGAATGPIVVGAAEGGTGIAGIGTSGALSGANTPFTVRGNITRADIPPVPNQAIRIRNQTGTANFRVTQIVIDVYGPASLQTIADAVTEALALFAPSNNTTAADLIAVVEGVATNPEIAISWHVDFNLTEATSAANGSITGTIRLTLGGETADIPLNFVIPQLFVGTLFDMQEDVTAATAPAHFAGLNNRGIITATGTTPNLVVTVSAFGTGPGGAGNLNDSMSGGWSAITILRAGQVMPEGRQAAAGDVLTVTGTLAFDGANFPHNAGNLGLFRGGLLPGDARIDDGNNNLLQTWTATHTLTPEDIAGNIEIRWNFWGGGLGGDGVRDNNFTINITGVTLVRN